MLLHQFIVVLVATAKRFESVLLSIPAAVRGVFSRDQVGAVELELEEVETERAA
ncbi:MAG: hypothetical protein WBW69_16465 [Candidatus Korobacteraceae bacterium]